MVKFIRQEAEEKSNEIKVSAEEVRDDTLFYHLTSSDRQKCQQSCNRSLLGADAISRAGLHVQEFNLEKLQLVEQEKAKIRKEYERREGQVDVKKKMCV